MEERFEATPEAGRSCRATARDRIRNRCEVTGRPRAFYRKLKVSRIALRELGNKGLIPASSSRAGKGDRICR
jgi:small subunit ribosomal protein S14